ncbi:hypothetical protein PAPYR_5440 [Paratrimastix pyriformis]|uniref:Uncharacterized protein n=1 Tax=Paratrimastix pyriformis TaxID=342808 RepID=A0ABQ8UHH7_9EUKA|nr:hypothetical protein PAPYR_5440 [Paratrimastix pyriformis]
MLTIADPPPGMLDPITVATNKGGVQVLMWEPLQREELRNPGWRSGRSDDALRIALNEASGRGEMDADAVYIEGGYVYGDSKDRAVLQATLMRLERQGRTGGARYIGIGTVQKTMTSHVNPFKGTGPQAFMTGAAPQFGVARPAPSPKKRPAGPTTALGRELTMVPRVDLVTPRREAGETQRLPASPRRPSKATPNRTSGKADVDTLLRQMEAGQPATVPVIQAAAPAPSPPADSGKQETTTAGASAAGAMPVATPPPVDAGQAQPSEEVPQSQAPETQPGDSSHAF